jgi:hypothetical protein
MEGLFQQLPDAWPEPEDRSGAECRICGHPFGHLYASGCPACGNVILNPPPPIFPHPNWVP